MNQEVRIFILPGGSMPERQTSGSVGYDVRIRAIVSPFDMDTQNPNLRKTLFDFQTMPVDPLVSSRVHAIPRKSDRETELIYRMQPRESVLVGIGFITQMSFPLFFWVAPRSGLTSKYGISVTNAPGTVDPDYRGEAGVIVFNRNEAAFDLRRGMRIAQIIFQEAVIPELLSITNPEELLNTSRGTGGFGSTGLN